MGLIQNKVTVSQPNSHVVVKNAGGLRGLTGETGPQGPQGVPGEAATVTAGTTTTLPAGSDATVQNVGSTSAAIFNFGIPKGDKGDTGETGAAATISVGSTSTLPAGSSATVTNSGTSSAAVFDFGIPKGDKGDTGATGADGYSPSATVTKTGDTATITITDKDGTTTASISDGTTPTVNDGTLTIQKNGTTVQTFSADQASDVTANITVPTQFSELSGTVSSSQIEDEAITTGSVSGTGTNITLADTMEGGAIESVELNGDTTQTTYSGKNLLNITKGTFTQNGITFTQNPDGSVTMNGTSTGNAYYEMNNTAASQTTITSGVRYTLSIGDVTLPAGQVIVQIRKVNPNVIYAAVNDKSASFTAPETTTTFTYIGVYGTGVTLNNLTIYPMLEVGSSMTSFEPYVGGTASPNPDYPQEVQTVTGEQSIEVRGGKNLFNKNAITSGYLVGRTDGVIAANVSYGASDFIRVQEGETYTFSSGFNYWYSAYYDSNKQYVGYPTNTATITIPSGVSYIRTSLLLTNLDTAQFEKGSSATTYEPYKGVTKTVNLGKNILNNTGTTTTVAGGITFTVNADKSVTVSGVSTSACWFKLSESMQLDGDYFLSGCPSGGSTTTFSLQTSYTGTVFGDYGSGVQLHAGTTDPVWIVVRSGQDFSTPATFYPQIEKGSTATTYAPYITAFGKNLLNPATLTADSRLNGDGTVLSGATGFSTSDYIPVEPNTTYTITRNAASSGFFGNLCQYNSNKTNIGNREYWDNTASYWPYHITTSSTTRYIRVSDQTTLFGTSFQIEKGSSATTYEPNMSGQLELCKIGTYQDYLYKSGEDWYVHKETQKDIFNGSENWADATATTGYTRCYVSSGGTVTVPDGYCDEFISRGSSSHGAYEYMWAQQTTNTVYIQVDNNRLGTASLANFKTWLGSHPASVYRTLATPTDTQITNATLISELEDLLSATTYSGTTYITVSGDLASPLEVVAEADSKLAPDSVYGAAIKDGAVSVDKIADLQALADALAPYLN